MSEKRECKQRLQHIKQNVHGNELILTRALDRVLNERADFAAARRPIRSSTTVPSPRLASRLRLRSASASGGFSLQHVVSPRRQIDVEPPRREIAPGALVASAAHPIVEADRTAGQI